MIFILLTYENIKKAVDTSSTYFEVVRLLKLKYSRDGIARLGVLLAEHKIDSSHLIRKTDYSKEKFTSVVNNSLSFHEVARKLNKHISYSKYIKFDIQRWNIDISHFNGRQHLALCKPAALTKKVPLELVFTNQIQIKTTHLKKRLFDEGIKEQKCERCLRTEYNGEPIPLELNHIDGNNQNNSLNNLEILDPNCHSLTPTFAGRNLRTKWTDEQFIEAVQRTNCIGQMAECLGLSPSISKNQKIYFLKRIHSLNLSTDHWQNTDNRVHSKDPWNKKPMSEMLIKNSFTKSDNLRRRLFQEKIKEQKCETCSITEWEGETLSLSLDHINGIHTDNRLENLRILCFICHARTPTYKGKNIGKNPVKKIKKTPIEKKEKQIQLCEFCNKIPIRRKKKKFCSKECLGLSRRVKNRPSNEELANLLKTHSKTEISKMFAVSKASITYWSHELST